MLGLLCYIFTGQDDFSPQSTTLMFTQAEVMALTPQCFTVTIVDDDIVEANEDIIYSITGTDPSVDILPNTNTVTFLIQDNDSMSNQICNVK